MPIRVRRATTRGVAISAPLVNAGPRAATAAGPLLRERPSPERRSVTRLRLTCLYGGVFMMAGTVLLAVVSLFAVQAVNRGSEPVFDLMSGTSVVVGNTACPQPVSGPGAGSVDGVLDACLTHQRHQTRASMVSSSLLALAALAVLSAVAGYGMAGYALSPLRRTTRTARRACEQEDWFVSRP
ncbi:hypothetical protein [Streptomyces antarcticus]|uniref:hypothetical protein n=1 Tax=Streptomyces antarcticus TaxID=2996458 RepID=UPI00226F382E|nr:MULTISPECIES: hypothetical protein [unclassified Streptomyces]MCY0943841.1 hypothetical protein [Streptomyces sp. H34-AA3]MCY0954629.1 hypothetical protein [Streptomyces sp. H27-S2]MCZ4085701.1 hypothetical protein [Streptomyces sp. H34-S5]